MNTKLNSIENELSEYEKSEIINYKYIYYIGNIQNKLNTITSNKYNIIINDHFLYRYKIISLIGYGTYGKVIKVKNYKRHTYNAIKIFNNLEQNSLKKTEELFLHEVNILNLLYNRKISKNIDDDIFTLYKDYGQFRKHNYIIFRLYSCNLYERQSKLLNFNISDTIIIITDIFSALDFFSSQYPIIIHGDIKPENILFKNDKDFNIVIGDFGLSIILNDTYIDKYKLIQTRWYRSPEIIYNIPFNEKIDIWSTGTIIYELISGKILFKAKYDNELLIHIHYILGLPTYSYIDKHENIKDFYEDYKAKNSTLYNNKVLKPYDGSDILDDYFNDIEPIYQLTRLIYMCLEYDTKERISTKEALKFIEDNINKNT